MNRRTFLKAVGLAFAAPGAVLGAVNKPLTMGVDVATGESFTATALFGPKVIEANGRWLETKKRQLQDFRPIIINGNPFYVILVHPNDPNREKLLAQGSEIGVIKYVEYQRLQTKWPTLKKIT